MGVDSEGVRPRGRIIRIDCAKFTDMGALA